MSVEAAVGPRELSPGPGVAHPSPSHAGSGQRRQAGAALAQPGHQQSPAPAAIAAAGDSPAAGIPSASQSVGLADRRIKVESRRASPGPAPAAQANSNSRLTRRGGHGAEACVGHAQSGEPSETENAGGPARSASVSWAIAASQRGATWSPVLARPGKRSGRHVPVGKDRQGQGGWEVAVSALARSQAVAAILIRSRVIAW